MTFLGGFSGAKGGSGGSFKQRPDTLRSTDTFEGLLGICAGPIKGLTRGLKSLKIDGTPLEDESGKLNFENFLAIFANGDPAAFPQKVSLRLGAGGSPVAVNLALSNTNASAPGPWVTKTVGNVGADFLDIRILVNQLYRQDKKGIFEHTANVEIQLKPTGAVNWISPMVGVPPQTWTPNGTAAAQFVRYLIPKINYASNGSYQPETNNGYFRIYGKTTSVAVHELRIAVPNEDAYADRGWDVRCRLIEKESVEADPIFEKRTLTWESVTAGYNTPLGETEPWRGLSWLQLYGKASDQLTGVPAVEGEYDTLIVPVPAPAVFDPEARTYSGAIWDGSWSRSFTTDPAWNINGLISDSLHGMSSVSPGAHLNKWDALEASKWFSELVPDGAGGMEPRSSLNIAINEPQKAAEFVPYLAGAVGALAWEENGGEWRMKVDKPEVPVDLFTLEAIQGEFGYSHTDVDTRFNDIIVVFRNAEFGYREDRVRVVDSAHINRFGRKPTTIVLIGCTGRQEALRRAIMRLRVSTRETRMVTFTTNRRGRLIRPLSTILIADGDLGTLVGDDENTRSTGRIVSVAPDRLSLTVRDPLRLELGVAYSIIFTVPNPDYAPDADVDREGENTTLPTVSVMIPLTNTAGQRGNVTTLYLQQALPMGVAPNANLSLNAAGLPALPKQYRVTAVAIDGETASISAIEIDTGKWTASDNGEAETGYVPPLDVVVPPVLNAVATIVTFDSDYAINRTLNVNWDRPAAISLAGYRTEYRVNGAEWTVLNSRTNLTSIEMINPQLGAWEFRVTAIDRSGRTSAGVVVAKVVDESLQPSHYPDGTPVGELRPAEPGATDGATVGENVKDDLGNVLTPEDLITSEGTAKDVSFIGGIPTATFKATVAQAEEDITALIGSIGDIEDIGQARDDAVQAKDDAIEAANAAGGSATIASSKRDEAAGFASTAEASALTAGDAASIANAKAVVASDAASSAATNSALSATHSNAARLQVVNSIPSTFAQDGAYYFNGYEGAPTHNPLPAGSWGSFPTVADVGKVAEVTSPNAMDISTIGVMQVQPGCTYRATFRFRTLSGTRSVNYYLLSLKSGYLYLNVTGNNDVVTATTTWQTKTIILTGDALLAAGATHVRALARTLAGASAVQWSIVGVEDVTESVKSATSAGIAQSHAATATAASSAATASETLSATHRAAAQKAAQRAQPSTFEDGALYFFGNSSLPSPTRLAPGVDGTNGAYLQTTDAANWGAATWKKRVPSSAGKRWKVRALVSHVSATASRVELGLETYNSVEGGTRQSYIGGGAIPVSSSAPVWVESVIVASAHPFISPSATLNYPAPYTSIQRVYALELIDVDALEQATAQAGIATQQAAIATDAKAAAQASAIMSASIGQGALNGDPGFDNYPSATVGALPVDWANWNGSSSMYRVADALGGYSLRMPAAAGANAGVYFGNLVTPQISTGGYYVIEADVTLDSGTFVGAAASFQPFNASSVPIHSTLNIVFATDPDVTNTVVGNGIVGRSYQFRKMVKVTAANAQGFRLYAMGHWITAGSTAAANSITWHKCLVRAATPAEIRDQTVLGPLEATVTTHSSVLATHETRLASWWQRVAAGAGWAQLKMTALDINGAVASLIDMAADKITLGVTTVLEVVAGKVTVSGDLYVEGGRIVVDTGTYMKVIGKGFGSSGQFVEWYGPKMAINLCSEANATAYLKTTGDAYFGGTLSAGHLKNSSQTSSTLATAEAICGPFGTNGNPIVVATSYSYSSITNEGYPAGSQASFLARAAQFNATSSNGFDYYGTKTETSNSTLTLSRKIGAGSHATVQSATLATRTWTFSGRKPDPGAGGDPGGATISVSESIAFTYTDSASGTSDREFKATLARGAGLGGGNQRVSIVTTEE